MFTTPKRPHASRMRRFVLEALEPRYLLAGTPLPALAAGQPAVAADTSMVIPQRAPGWMSFDDLPKTATAYPSNTTQPGVAWHAVDFIVSENQSFGQWDPPRDAPFAHAGGMGSMYNIFALTEPISAIDVPLAQEATALFRRPLTLSAIEATANRGALDLVCDDGCIVYLNGVEIVRYNIPAEGVHPGTYVSDSGQEQAYLRHSFHLIAAGVVLEPGSANVLAVELHQARTSQDLGFDLSLTLDWSTCSADADLDGNSTVDHRDLAILASHYGRRQATEAQGDLDCDGYVGLTDTVRLRNEMVRVTAASPVAPQATPVVGMMPATLAIAAVRTESDKTRDAPSTAAAATNRFSPFASLLRARRQRTSPADVMDAPRTDAR